MKKNGIFVVDCSKEFVRQLQQAISLQNDMYFIGSAENGKDALIQIKSIKDIDVIITELVMPVMDGFTFLNELKSYYSSNRMLKPMVLAHSGLVNQNVLNMINSLGVDHFLLKPYDINTLLQTIRRTFKNQANTHVEPRNLEQQITDLLREIGIPAHIKGYNYIRTAITLSYSNYEFIGQVTKNLYPEIARRYKTTGSRVERAIRHAIEIAFTRGNVDTIDSIFGYTIASDKSKPTNSEFIAMLSDYINVENRNKIMI